eukprot:scaffold33485_cov59-Attheya_sp.AAC.2
MTNPVLVKSIQAVYRVLLTAKQGVVEELCSWYVPSVPNPPSPTSESSSLASLKTSNTTAAKSTEARRAELSANIPFDEGGFHHVDSFWEESVLAIKGMDNDLPP